MNTRSGLDIRFSAGFPVQTIRSTLTLGSFLIDCF